MKKNDLISIADFLRRGTFHLLLANIDVGYACAIFTSNNWEQIMCILLVMSFGTRKHKKQRC